MELKSTEIHVHVQTASQTSINYYIATETGLVAIERLCFLASFPQPGTGKREGGEKTQHFNRFASRPFIGVLKEIKLNRFVSPADFISLPATHSRVWMRGTERRTESRVLSRWQRDKSDLDKWRMKVCPSFILALRWVDTASWESRINGVGREIEATCSKTTCSA